MQKEKIEEIAYKWLYFMKLINLMSVKFNENEFWSTYKYNLFVGVVEEEWVVLIHFSRLNYLKFKIFILEVLHFKD